MRLGLVLLLASLSLVLVTAGAPAAGPGAATLSKGASKKAKKCKKKQVRLVVGKRSRCVPLKAALPEPRAVDQRLAVVVEGLTPPLGSAPDPKGKLPTPMEQVYRQFGPKALPGMETVVKTALPRLDRLAAAKAARSSSLAAASAGEANTVSASFGNVTIDARLSIATEASGQFSGLIQLSMTTDKGGGKTVKVTTEVPIRLKGFGFRSDVCPGADGKLNAKDGIGITIRTEVRSNGGKSLDEYFIYEVADETELQGIVGDDAKLDTLEIRSIEEVNEKAWQPIVGGILARGTIVRNTVVDMRTGQYKPSVTLINVGVVLSGLRSLFSASNRQAVAERLKKAADAGFAATVDYVMKRYRELEAGWQKPNACAKLRFGRPNRSLTLRRGDKGTESVQVDAIRGGSPPRAKWTSVDAANGLHALASDFANPTSFSYDVANAGPGVEYKATLRAVSKAGVAEDIWIQKTEQKSIERVFGTYDLTSNQSGSVLTWSGDASFARYTPPVLGGPNGGFKLTSGIFTVTASGNGSLLSAPLCSQKGSKQFLVAPSSEFTAFGTPPDLGPPYEYSFSLASDNTSLPMLDITLYNCGAGSEELEGDTFSYPVPLALQPTSLQSSADGITFSGSESSGGGGFTVTKSWSFQGAE